MRCTFDDLGSNKVSFFLSNNESYPVSVIGKQIARITELSVLIRISNIV